MATAAQVGDSAWPWSDAFVEAVVPTMTDKAIRRTRSSFRDFTVIPPFNNEKR